METGEGMGKGREGKRMGDNIQIKSKSKYGRGKGKGKFPHFFNSTNFDH